MKRISREIEQWEIRSKLVICWKDWSSLALKQCRANFHHIHTFFERLKIADIVQAGDDRDQGEHSPLKTKHKVKTSNKNWRRSIECYLAYFSHILIDKRPGIFLLWCLFDYSLLSLYCFARFDKWFEVWIFSF